ncbi:hypothetical protein [Bacillus sp. NPDC094106]|uniref:hypothetical protein n=1 Tax=Bacillus sp. NPDC094106 TaxID=3363949 RepID=UPI003826CECE
MTKKMYEVEAVARICEVSAIATSLRDAGNIKYEADDLYDCFVNIIEPIYNEWANQTVDFKSYEKEDYITAYAERVLLERYGTNKQTR